LLHYFGNVNVQIIPWMKAVTKTYSVIDEAIDEWCKRLYACIRAKGGHFEHLV